MAKVSQNYVCDTLQTNRLIGFWTYAIDIYKMTTPAKKKASRENGKKGGRKKGSKNPETLEREAVLKEFRQKTMRAADILFNRQLKLAEGHMYLYKIEKEVIIGPRGGKKIIPKKPVRVTAEWEIEAYLMNQLDDGDIQDPEDTYYYITAEKGDTRALDSLLDRAFGKSTNVHVTEDEDGKQMPIQGNVIQFASQKDEPNS